MQSAAKETVLGRKKKFKEPTKKVSAVVPTSVYESLVEASESEGEGAIQGTLTDVVLDALFFDRDLRLELKGSQKELVASASAQGREFSRARAQTIARLVKLGLEAEKHGLLSPKK